MSAKYLIPIFLLALAIRFLYFPNVNFAYDQARDSFAALDIVHGHLKIIGPTTTISDKVFHGVLFYYLLAPIYFFTNGNPEVAAAVLRVINALGIFVVFYIGRTLFKKEIGLVAAILYAFSYEQSQYSLFFGHPALGVVPVLLLYLGLALVIFKKNHRGLILALFGLGLALEFEDVNIILFVNFFLILGLFWKNFMISKKIIFQGLGAFVLTISPFILSEIKFHFRMSQVLFSNLADHGAHYTSNFGHIIFVLERFINDNIFASIVLHLELIALILGLGFLIKSKYRNQGLFLTIWFFGGMIPNYLSNQFSYQYTPGASVSLLILAGFSIYRIFKKQKILGLLLLAMIIFSNLNLIFSQNKYGPNSDIIIQKGMLTTNQKQALDFIYKEASGESFAVNALTVPLNVKTTWDYLFNWYGKSKYGYLPVWGGNAAEGFAGTLQVETDRSKLPIKQFTIIEPPVGIDSWHVNDFFTNENYFSNIIKEQQFGTISVQEREKI